MILASLMFTGCMAGADTSMAISHSDHDVEPEIEKEIDHVVRPEGPSSSVFNDKIINEDSATIIQTPRVEDASQDAPNSSGIVLDQLNSEATNMVISQQNQGQAATLVKLDHPTLITSITWSGSMISPDRFMPGGDHSADISALDNSQGESAQFLIQIFAGESQPGSDFIEEHVVEARIISHTLNHFEYIWDDGLLEPLEAGHYWISIIGLEDPTFYWTVERGGDPSSLGSGGSARDVDESWRSISSNDLSQVEGCGLSIKVEATEFTD
jgi:hypothetical protein